MTARRIIGYFFIVVAIFGFIGVLSGPEKDYAKNLPPFIFLTIISCFLIIKGRINKQKPQVKEDGKSEYDEVNLMSRSEENVLDSPVTKNAEDQSSLENFKRNSMTPQFIVGICFIAIAFIGVIAVYFSVEKDYAESIPPIIVLTIIGSFLMIKKFKTKEQKLQLKKEKEMRKKYCETHVTLKHVRGLPLASDTECELALEADKIEFKGSGNTFSLDLDKVTELKVIKEQVFNRYPSSSIIGNRIYMRRAKTTYYNLRITYTTNNRIAHIVFKVPFHLLNVLMKWEKSIIIKEQETIEL